MDEKQIRKVLEMKDIKKGVEDYVKIIVNYKNVNITMDTDFQRIFNGFYKVIFRPKMFYKDYYSFMEKHKNDNPSFSDTLYYFFNLYDKLEASFSSKLLHTIYQKLPIWDKYVLEYFELKAPSRDMEKKERVKQANNVYEEIKTKYVELQNNEEGKMMIKLFDEYFPKNRDINEIKKIDFIIWSVGKMGFKERIKT
jgi:hypothetical protein